MKKDLLDVVLTLGALVALTATSIMLVVSFVRAAFPTVQLAAPAAPCDCSCRCVVEAPCESPTSRPDW
jgi:hypothetical protein